MTNTDHLPENRNNFFDNELENLVRRRFSFVHTPLPAVNIREDENAFVVEVAAPGLDKKDFSVELNEDLLIISSHKETEQKKENERILKKEFSFKSFTRTFHLPDEGIDRDKISAKYENGILTILIPKEKEKKIKASKEIKIN